MLHTASARRGMVVAPHHLAAQAGLAVLREGGNAIEAMVAAAATVAAVYPHMNGLGGDGFWLIHAPGAEPVAIDAAGPAAAGADPDFYRRQGYQSLPARGPHAALTVAGTVSGWARALELSAEWGGRLPLERLLEDAIHYAAEGVPVTRSQHDNTVATWAELREVPGFAGQFLPEGAPPAIGATFRQPALAATLRTLSRQGLDAFYRGELGRAVGAELARLGSPLSVEDLARYRAQRVRPLSLSLAQGTVYNLPPPTQGLAALIILGLFERLPRPEAESFAYVHALVEASKQAFAVRDAHVFDPAYMTVAPGDFLAGAALDAMAAAIDPRRAAPWGGAPGSGDTVWLGAVDGEGRAVSFIQSLYWEFGSGLVLEESGLIWQNRGASFHLAEGHPNRLAPGRRPFHTIQPPLTRLGDGRVMVYGTMGGEGQPQTQAALFTRHLIYGRPLQAAITAPRWLLGRTWGQATASLRIEGRFGGEVIEALGAAGHPVEVVGDFDPVMGHAGALVRHASGLIEGAADPRGDGVAAAF